jgi:hypothetical protein
MVRYIKIVLTPSRRYMGSLRRMSVSTEYVTQAVEANSRAILFDLSDMCKMSAIIYWYDMYRRVWKIRRRSILGKCACLSQITMQGCSITDF